jgi:hypothetical protein
MVPDHGTQGAQAPLLEYKASLKRDIRPAATSSISKGYAISFVRRAQVSRGRVDDRFRPERPKIQDAFFRAMAFNAVDLHRRRAVFAVKMARSTGKIGPRRQPEAHPQASSARRSVAPSGSTERAIGLLGDDLALFQSLEASRRRRVLHGHDPSFVDASLGWNSLNDHPHSAQINELAKSLAQEARPAIEEDLTPYGFASNTINSLATAPLRSFPKRMPTVMRGIPSL